MINTELRDKEGEIRSAKLNTLYWLLFSLRSSAAHAHKTTSMILSRPFTPSISQSILWVWMQIGSITWNQRWSKWNFGKYMQGKVYMRLLYSECNKSGDMMNKQTHKCALRRLARWSKDATGLMLVESVALDKSVLFNSLWANHLRFTVQISVLLGNSTGKICCFSGIWNYKPVARMLYRLDVTHNKVVETCGKACDKRMFLNSCR